MDISSNYKIEEGLFIETKDREEAYEAVQLLLLFGFSNVRSLCGNCSSRSVYYVIPNTKEMECDTLETVSYRYSGAILHTVESATEFLSGKPSISIWI
jgi:hypothetical protein